MTGAVICEWNPFHHGHAYLLSKMKERGMRVVALMSGSLTQRGEVAVVSKYDRAAAAVACGADLVLELPYPFSGAGAERFAAGGVDILCALGCIDALCFGSESGEVSALAAAAAAQASPAFAKTVEEELRLGQAVSYRTAWARALQKTGGTGELSGSNDRLALGYLRRLAEVKSGIEPIAVPRLGEAFNPLCPAEPAASHAFPAANLATPMASPASPAANLTTPMASPAFPAATPAAPMASPAFPATNLAAPMASPAFPATNLAAPMASPAFPAATPAAPMASPTSPTGNPAFPATAPAQPPFLSASTVRRMLAAGDFDGVKSAVPPAMATVLSDAFAAGRLAEENRLFPILAAPLRTGILSLDDVPDCTFELAARLTAAAKKACAYQEFLALAGTRRYSVSRIRRVLLAALCGVRTGDLATPRYTCVLAANSVGREILAAARKTAALPILTKPADYRRYDAAVERAATLCARADAVWELLCRSPRDGGAMLREKPRML